MLDVWHSFCVLIWCLPWLSSDFPLDGEEVRHDQLVGGDRSVRLQKHQSRVGGTSKVDKRMVDAWQCCEQGVGTKKITSKVYFAPVDVQLPYLVLPDETTARLFYCHIAVSVRLEYQSHFIMQLASQILQNLQPQFPYQIYSNVLNSFSSNFCQETCASSWS